MAATDLTTTTTTNLTGTVSDVSIDSKSPDLLSNTDETPWDFPDADKQNGYLQSIPELKAALYVAAQRICGLGYEVLLGNPLDLEHVFGTGEDTFDSIIMQAWIESKAFGDSFTELIVQDKRLINMKRLYTGDMRIIRNSQGIITRYEQKNTKSGKVVEFKPEQILHLVNDKLGHEVHGTSIINALKIYIDAYNEAIADERKIRHRELALGILRVDTNDATQQAIVTSKYQTAINNAEALVVGEGVELLDNPNQPRDRIQWLQFLINQFYQAVGTPKVLVTSEGYTEAGGKAGLLAFEPVERSEKIKLEKSIWNQMYFKIKFTRAPSMLGDAIQTQQKNTGQTGIQPNEAMMSASRTE